MRLEARKGRGLIILPDCYRETVTRWLINLVTWREGPAFLGDDVWGGNIVFKCSAAGLEMMPVVSMRSYAIVFALMRGDEFIAGLKLERMDGDAEFVEEMTRLALAALRAAGIS